MIGISGWCSCQLCSDFQGAGKQQRCLQTNHFHIFRLSNIHSCFEFDVELLTVTHSQCSTIEGYQCLVEILWIYGGRMIFHLINRTVFCHKAISKNQHSITGEDGCVVIPFLMHTWISSTYFCLVHQVVVKKCEVVIYFQRQSLWNDGFHIVLVEIICQKHHQWADAFSSK